MTRFTALLLILFAALNAGQPAAAQTDAAPAAPAEPVAVPDTSGYQQVAIDINGYESYNLGHQISEYFSAEELTQYRSSDSDGIFNFYDLAMVNEAEKLEYTLSIGTYGPGEIIGSVEMHMDVSYGAGTFDSIKAQLEEVAGQELPSAADSTVSGGLHLNLEDADGDTLELSWIPANDAGINTGTGVFVTSLDYIGALMQSIMDGTNAAPAADAASQ